MIIFFFKETTSARISALEYIGNFFSEANLISQLLFLIADDFTIKVELRRFFFEWPIKIFIPAF